MLKEDNKTEQQIVKGEIKKNKSNKRFDFKSRIHIYRWVTQAASGNKDDRSSRHAENQSES